ncbi:MAG: hypothetical protein HPY83_10240 [Anaerolineae bacterium]|nr:hypothetical protein [Anaerolineae bacterium]
MRRSGVLWGILLVLVGLLLLLSNLGVIAVDVWSLLWPLLLIGVGVWLVWGVLAKPEGVEIEEVSIPLQGAARARVRLDHGAGQLRVTGRAAPDQLLSGRFAGGLKYDVLRRADLLDVDLRVPSRVYPQFAFPWTWWSGRGALDWEVALNPEVPLELHLKTGASATWLDLSELQVTELRLDTGASSTEVTMPAAAGYTRADVRSGVAGVVIRIPEGVEAHIRASGGLADTSVSPRFERVGPGAYRSPSYATAPNRLELNVEVGLGSVSIR